MKKAGLFLLVIALLFCVTSCTQNLTAEATAAFRAVANSVLDIATRLAADPTSVPGATVEKSDPTETSQYVNYTYTGCASATYGVSNMQGTCKIAAATSETSADGIFYLKLDEFTYNGTSGHKMLVEATFTGLTLTSVDQIKYEYFIYDGVKYYPPKS